MKDKIDPVTCTLKLKNDVREDYAVLGTNGTPKMDEFPEKVQTAFEPRQHCRLSIWMVKTNTIEVITK